MAEKRSTLTTTGGAPVPDNQNSARPMPSATCAVSR